MALIDKTHTPRKLPFNVETLETALDGALEHASHGWAALEREIKVNRLNPDSWPPRVEAPVGTAEYHLSIVITSLYEVFQTIRDEAENEREIMDQVNKYLEGKK